MNLFRASMRTKRWYSILLVISIIAFFMAFHVKFIKDYMPELQAKTSSFWGSQKHESLNLGELLRFIDKMQETASFFGIKDTTHTKDIRRLKLSNITAVLVMVVCVVMFFVSVVSLLRRRYQ